MDKDCEPSFPLGRKAMRRETRSCTEGRRREAPTPMHSRTACDVPTNSVMSHNVRAATSAHALFSERFRQNAIQPRFFRSQTEIFLNDRKNLSQFGHKVFSRHTKISENEITTDVFHLFRTYDGKVSAKKKNRIQLISEAIKTRQTLQ